LGDALEALKRCCYDVVLLDLNLPDSMGLETFYKMHSLFPDVPILILTGLIDENLSWHALNEGAMDYLVKGEYDEIVLVETILETLKRNEPGSKV
jgi:DNA-binding response OmpR family regulator